MLRSGAYKHSPANGHCAAMRTAISRDCSWIGLFLPAQKCNCPFLNVCSQRCHIESNTAFLRSIPTIKYSTLAVFNQVWQKSKDLMDTNFWRVQWQHAGERQETAQLLHLTEELIRHERLPRGKKDYLEVPPTCIQYQYKDSERSPGKQAIHNPGRASPITRLNPHFSLVQCFSIHTSAFTFYFNCTVVVKFQLSAKHQCSSQRWCQDRSRETRRRSQLLFGTAMQESQPRPLGREHERKWKWNMKCLAVL